MPAFKYTGNYGRYVQGIGLVRPGDVVHLPSKPPGYEWISVDAPVKAPESHPEPVSASPANTETPAPTGAPETLTGPPGKGSVPVSPSVAAVVH